MSYLLKNSRRKRQISKRAALAVAIMVLAVIFYSFFGRLASQAIFAAAKPIWNLQNRFSEQLMKMYSWIQNKEQLASLNIKLQGKLDAAEAALQTMNDLKKENESLKVLLGRDNSEKRILAGILAKPNHSLYDTLVLDAGKEQGVALGDKVLIHNFIIGTIWEVFSNYSKATLLSSPGEALRAQIGDSRIEAEAFGRGGGNFIVKLPKETKISKGDAIKLPGLNQKFYGTVENIEQTITGPFQSILFRLPVNINDFDWVEIVKN